MLKLSDLALRPDVRVGSMLVSPSRRLLEGPGGSAHFEPLIMQVFLLLLDAAGEVVTRKELFDQCWGSVIVGDASLNRIILRIRKAGAQVAPDLFEVETIPRTGYRLTGQILRELDAPSSAHDEHSQVSRRMILGIAALGLAPAGAAFWFARNRSDPRATELVRRAERIMLAAMPGSDAEAAKLLRQAVEIEPDRSRHWGLLALALRGIAEHGGPAGVSTAVLQTEAAAERALAIDPKEPNARTALATVRPEFGNWGASEDALRTILDDSPSNVPALSYLVMILQAVGRSRESWTLNERALAAEPLSPLLLFRRALKLWINGRVDEADIAVDRALQLWPKHAAVWNARLYIFAFTGRAHAALAALHNDSTRPPSFNKESIVYWRSSLRALQTGARADVDDAVSVNLAAAPTAPYFAIASMMVLSALGRVDAAFEVAEGTLLRRGKLIGNIATSSRQTAVHDQYWRRTMNLFTPATAVMRADARFEQLCAGMGMLRYWRERRVRPDEMYGLDFV
jgi:DNA-binding winged helix-turn-helix (wHTH) protein/tetratricopeptide (TPR) repeat protein